MDAYETLTSIQGFDSFGLSSASSAEEIERAYQTQTLIWHPDKNPNDPAALQHYKRLRRAYETLIDPTARAAHDEALATGGEASVDVDSERELDEIGRAHV